MSDVEVTPVDNLKDGNKGGGKSNRKYKLDDEIEAEVDQELENGPIYDRSCTDCLCCLLFIAFCCGMVGSAYYGYQNGNPTLLLSPFDSAGNACGYDTGFEDYKLLYWADLT